MASQARRPASQMAPTRSGASSKGDDEIAEYFRGGGSDDDHIRDAGDMGDRDTRPRWAGTPDELARVLVAMADTSGKSFIRYDESKDTKAARLNKDRITAAGHHLRKLREVHAGLNFKKSTITAALRIVVKKMESKWCLSDLQQRDWIDTMTHRIANLCAHTSACLRKERDWVVRIFAGCDGDGRSGTGSRASACPPQSTDVAECPWEYGWSEELNIAYRVRRGTRKKELSLPIEVPSDAKATDCIIAKWRDNSTHTVHDVTVEVYRKAATRRVAAPLLEVYWEKEHRTTHNRIYIQQRTDREQLLSLFEQEHQLTQVALWKFGPLPLPQPRPVPRDCAALMAAIDFLVPLGEAWANDSIKDKDVLKKDKDARLKKLGIALWGKVPQQYSTSSKRNKASKAVDGSSAGATTELTPMLKRPSCATEVEPTTEPVAEARAEVSRPKKRPAFATGVAPASLAATRRVHVALAAAAVGSAFEAAPEYESLPATCEDEIMHALTQLNGAHVRSELVDTV